MSKILKIGSFVLFAALLLFIVQLGIPKKQVIPSSSDPVFQEVEFVSSTFNDVNKQVKIQGKSLSLQPRQFGPVMVTPIKDMLIKDARILFLDHDQTVATLTANKALVQSDISLQSLGDSTMTLQGDVILSLAGGKQLFCDQLRWSKDSGTFTSPTACLIKEGNRTERLYQVKLDSPFQVAKK